MRQQAMTLGLRQQWHSFALPIEFGGVHQHHSRIGARSRSHHVARVLLMAGCIANDELAAGGRKIPIRHIDRDTLLPLGSQAIGELSQINLAGL